jgi:DNA-binding response OmpR family regulator/curved DNA-binding protein CbpA
MKKNEINVLIVDDDRAIGQTLSQAITRAGFKAVVATRADEALNIVKLKHVQAAIVDCMLPVTNGVALVEELRKTRFDNGIVILISGIFKDKAFETEALKRTNAICYLQKPFGPLDLISALTPHLEPLLGEQKYSLQTVLTKKLDSKRERVKVVEHLEEVSGVEVANVIAILMDAKVSGFLNLVSASGDIFGVSLKDGLIAGVDSENVDSASVRFLIDAGYLTEEDWTEFQLKETKRSPLGKLVNLGYISPHAAEQARHEQIVADLKTILRFDILNTNFVPEDSSAVTGVAAIDLTTLFAEINDTLDALLTKDFLATFFKPHWEAAIKPSDSFSQETNSKLPIVTRGLLLFGEFSGVKSISTLLKIYPSEELEILKALYCLVITRQILFSDVAALKSFEEDAYRLGKLLESIKGKDPEQIFHYFGTSEAARETEIGAVFHEFVKTNHPDRLPPDAPTELRNIAMELFSIVSGAHSTLSNPELRQAHLVLKQNKVMEREMRSETISAEGLELLRRGMYQKAVEKFQEAISVYKRDDTECLLIWATVKAKNKVMSKHEIAPLQQKLESMSTEQKNNPYYHMALGLVKVANGEISAVNSFEKAIALQPHFVEARREISAVSAVDSSDDSSNLLTGDITQIVSQIFKRKVK